jgi:hypothetical protein
MRERKPGFYWVDWAEDSRASVAGPLVAEWDGKSWWMARVETYRFDSEVVVLSDCLHAPLTFGRELRLAASAGR